MPDLIRLFVAACLLLVMYHTLGTTRPAEAITIAVVRVGRRRKPEAELACFSLGNHGGDFAASSN